MAKFCPNCGARLDQAPKICPNCGADLQGASGPGSQNESVNENMFPPPGKKSGKQGPPVVLFIFLGLAAILAAVIFALTRPEPGSEQKKRFGGAKIKKQTIWENEYVKVDALKLDEADTDIGSALHLSVENRSDQEIVLGCLSMAVNGGAVQKRKEFEIQAEPGKSTKGEIILDYYSCDDMQIRTFGDISVELEAADAAGNVLARSGILTLETDKAGEGDTPAYKRQAQLLQEEQGVVISSEGFREIGTSIAYGINFHVENQSSETVRVVMRDIVLNDLPYDTGAEGTFQPGTIGVVYAYTDFNDLKAVDDERMKEKKSFFPVTQVTGTCDIYSADSSAQIASFPFTWKKQ